MSCRYLPAHANLLCNCSTTARLITASPVKKSPASPHKIKTRSRFIDDKAEELDDGVGNRSSDLSDVPEDMADSDLAEFIVPDKPVSTHNDQMQQQHSDANDAAQGTVDRAVSADVQESEATASSSTQISVEDVEDTRPGGPEQASDDDKDEDMPMAIDPVTPKRKRTVVSHQKSRQIDTDEEEDLTAISKDDSMYNRSATVRSSLLPPPILTRSARKNAGSSSPLEVFESPAKKPRLDDQAIDRPPSASLRVPSVKVRSKQSSSGRKRHFLSPISSPAGSDSPAAPPVQYSPGLKIPLKDEQMAGMARSVMAELMPFLATTIQGALKPDVSLPSALLHSIPSQTPAFLLAKPTSSMPSTAVVSLRSATVTPAGSLPSAVPTSAMAAPSTDDPILHGQRFGSANDYKAKAKAVDIPDIISVASESILDLFDVFSEAPKDALPPLSIQPLDVPAAATTSGSVPVALPLIPQPTQATSQQSVILEGSTYTGNVKTEVAVAEDDLVLVGLDHAFGDAAVGSVKDEATIDGASSSTVFLEDLESYHLNFDPNAACEVYDVALQDPLLKCIYDGLPPLA
ncbi:hypothetical protein B0H17DRAFT_1198252 [Mycena rosella]|uniref:Uncharacterized protein n=1 Tax=Mycena rosella TaxID=1033263 RepID=A0AAD7GI46_MYCRO|nr:hypothetical protein B0H17DRAFT_1198252 [Mycena rosella]